MSPASEDPDGGAFFEPRDGGFAATELTRGPWSGDSQHAGPPAALIAREIERCSGIGEQPVDRHVGRITFEILRPVPIAELRVGARVVRPGRRVDMVEAELAGPDGEVLVRARGWRLLRRGVDPPADVSSLAVEGAAGLAGRPSGETGRPTPPEELAAEQTFFPTGHEVGYHSAMEYRFARGGFLETGPATCWMRMRHPLIAGERPSPLQRVMIAADSGNGISATLDFSRYVFINVDLSVHLGRMPQGEWVCLDSLTTAEADGAGLADTLLLDPGGPIGRAAQTLLISER